MSDPEVSKHIDALNSELRKRAWAGARVEGAWRELTLRRAGRERFRQATRLGAGALALAAALVAALAGLRASRPGVAPTANHSVGEESRPERIELGGGTDVRLEQGARLDVRERTDARVVVALQGGTARFQVRHDPRRLFRVEVGDVAVEDLGTAFVVENARNSVRIAVSEGSVSVTAPVAGKRQKITLAAGQSGVYSLHPSASEAADVAPPAVTPPAAIGQPTSSSDGQAAASWRELARAGKNQRAYELLAPSGFREVRDDAGDLLLASDAARLSRHPAESVVLLRRLLARHEQDPRAPSAAFTLGWLLMNELGRPREAAAAFAKAEALAPRGNLAEDAVARAVEAWYRAGEEMRAKAEVERYRKAYPQGRHLAMLERLVKLP